MEFVNGTDPNEIMYGQVWEKLPGGYHLLSTDNDNPINDLSGDASNHIPGKALKGGLPNIKGDTKYILYHSVTHHTGSPFQVILGASVQFSRGGMGSTDFTEKMATLQFNASNNNRRYGAYQGTSNDNVIGNHIAAVMWKRTS